MKQDKGTWVIRVRGVNGRDVFEPRKSPTPSFWIFFMEKALWLAGYDYDACNISYEQANEEIQPPEAA
jgi:hypothetical protein